MTSIQPISFLCQLAKVDVSNFYEKDDQAHGVITKALGDVERCVKGYSNREGFFGKLGGLFYRIWNAVKAVFGQSDWQKGRRALTTLVQEGLPAAAKARGIEDRMVVVIKSMVEGPVKKDADIILRAFIKVNEFSVIKDNMSEIKNIFDKNNVESCMDAFTKKDNLAGVLDNMDNVDEKKWEEFQDETIKLFENSELKKLFDMFSTMDM